jgi:hypothetical protein
MSALAVARSSLSTSLVRYSRSWGLWLLLLIAPVGARFWVPRDDGTTIVIAINQQLPVMTSAVLGVCLGVVVSTLLLPAAYIYLRSNTTRRQPWQVEEVSTASTVAIMLGRFAADVAMLLTMLAALNLAGWFLAWLVVPADELNLLHVSFALWVIAAPALMGLAAIRILFDALPFTRGAFGDFLYFVIWVTSIALPSAADRMAPGFGSNMYDFGGFVRPLIYGSPIPDPGFSIGGSTPAPGRIAIDAMAGLLSPGYLGSRAAWSLIAIAIAVVAGVVYRPHRTRRRSLRFAKLSRWLAPGAPKVADPNAPAAVPSAHPLLALGLAEFRLIGPSRIFAVLAAGIALSGVFADYRHVVGPAALLLLIFGLTAHAGRSETRGLLSLTRLGAVGPMARRLAFVVAGISWSLLLALPAVLAQTTVEPLALAAATGGFAAVVAVALAALSGSSFAPRIVLLIAWYVYTSG